MHPGNDVLQEGPLLHRGFLLLRQTVLHDREGAELSQLRGEMLHLLGDGREGPGRGNGTVNALETRERRPRFTRAASNMTEERKKKTHASSGMSHF